MSRVPVSGNAMPTSHLPFSPAIRAGDFVFVSGQAAVDDTGAYVPGTFAEEMSLSFSNLERILAVAGGGLDDVVQVRAFLGDMKFRDEYNQIYGTCFTGPFPARTTLAADLGGLKFEIDVIAHIPLPVEGRL